MRFTEAEKALAKALKDAGLGWEPSEGDWFWSTRELSHQFYLGENLPSSFFFREGEPYVFDSSMTWHLEQGGLKLDAFVWLPSWEQGRAFLREKGFVLTLQDQDGKVRLEAARSTERLTSTGETDLEALYRLMREAISAL